MADNTNQQDDTKKKDEQEKQREQRRKRRKRLNIALWAALILSTAGNLTSGVLEFWRSREEHQEIVQLVEHSFRHDPLIGKVTLELRTTVQRLVLDSGPMLPPSAFTLLSGAPIASGSFTLWRAVIGVPLVMQQPW